MSDAEIRDRLAAERSRTVHRIASLDVEFAGLVEAGNGTNIDDEHDPEGATIGFERAQVSALLDAAQVRLCDIDRALAELGRHAYGSCEICGQPIAAGRLSARPSARTCITCASR